LSYSTRRYTHRQFVAWGLGAAVAAGFLTVAQVALLAYGPNLSPVQSAIFTGTLAFVAAFVGGGLGYAFSVLFDEAPFMKHARHDFLYSLIGTALFFALFTFVSLAFIGSLSDAKRNLFYMVIAFSAAFIAAGSKGVINNIRAEANEPEADEYGKHYK
jgi:hypothetical protein